jgi:hypothetical protein
MAGSGRISLLVSKELQVLATVAKSLDREVAAQLRKHTRGAAEPIWAEETRGRVHTRLQARVLSDTARVAVSDQNVTLKSATIGKLSSGIASSVLAGPAEFGGAPGRPVQTKSRKGTAYTRRLGGAFGQVRRDGYVVFPAVRAAVPRVAALWIQTAYRTVADTFEKGAR